MIWLSQVPQTSNMKAALILVVVAALAAPSLCWTGPGQLLDQVSQQIKESTNAIIETAKLQIANLLNKEQKDKVEILINDTIIRIKSVLGRFQGLTDRIPPLKEKVKLAAAKVGAALEEFKGKAKAALSQENIEKVKASIKDALNKAGSKIQDALQVAFQ